MHEKHSTFYDFSWVYYIFSTHLLNMLYPEAMSYGWKAYQPGNLDFETDQGKS